MTNASADAIDRAGPRIDLADFDLIPQVQSKARVRAWLERAVLEHALRAADALFGGLEDERHRPRQLASTRRKKLRRRSTELPCGRRARKRDGCPFERPVRPGPDLARSAAGVHVGAQQDRRGRAVRPLSTPTTPVWPTPVRTSSRPSRRKSFGDDRRPCDAPGAPAPDVGGNPAAARSAVRVARRSTLDQTPSLAAVDGNAGPGHQACAVRAEKADDVSDLFRPAEAAERHILRTNSAMAADLPPADATTNRPGKMIEPGATLSTRMLSGASSRASPLARLISADFTI